MSKIILMANDLPGVEVAKFLKESGEDLLRLYIHEEGAQKSTDLIISESGCKEVYKASLLKDPLHVENLQSLGADYIITVYWTYLLKPDVINSVKDTVNFHPALLPINRGWFPHVHSIIDGTPLGVTLHRIDEGADTGPIWAQKEVELLLVDTAKTVYDRLQNEMVELFKANWPKIKSGSISPKEQDHDQAIYHKKKEIEQMDFLDLEKKMTIREIINILRARSFGDLGFSFFEEGGKKVYLNLRLSDKFNFRD